MLPSLFKMIFDFHTKEARDGEEDGDSKGDKDREGDEDGEEDGKRRRQR